MGETHTGVGSRSAEIAILTWIQNQGYTAHDPKPKELSRAKALHTATKRTPSSAAPSSCSTTAERGRNWVPAPTIACEQDDSRGVVQAR